MLDQIKLYSYKGEEPTNLPHRITLSDGRSRTDASTFTEEEILDAGFTGPYDLPNIDHTNQIIVWDRDNLEYKVENITQSSTDLTDEQILEIIRNERNYRLFQCDWTDLPNTPLSPEKKSQWMNYRQELRDLPQTITDVNNFEWPTTPN